MLGGPLEDPLGDISSPLSSSNVKLSFLFGFFFPHKNGFLNFPKLDGEGVCLVGD